jgi:hypothetical protein
MRITMKKCTLNIIAGALICGLLLVSSALAMESANYQLNWFTPLTGSGGGAASSANYAVNLTVGQSAISMASSANYDGCLGYWCGGASVDHRVYLPLVVRN